MEDFRTADERLLEVERFEHVAATAERVLLRLDGRYLERPGRRILDATLFVDDGLAVHRHAPLPDPGGPDADIPTWIWRAAFAIPSSYLADARTQFALQAEPGELLALCEPQPTRLADLAPESRRGTVRLARRYAAAIATIITVAVTPGTLPAAARTEVLKVRRPDGSIVYLSTDGRQLSMLPPDAEVIDETGAQPAAAPAPPPAPSTPSTTTATSAPPAAHQTIQADTTTNRTAAPKPLERAPAKRAAAKTVPSSPRRAAVAVEHHSAAVDSTAPAASSVTAPRAARPHSPEVGADPRPALRHPSVHVPELLSGPDIVLDSTPQKLGTLDAANVPPVNAAPLAPLPDLQTSTALDGPSTPQPPAPAATRGRPQRHTSDHREAHTPAPAPAPHSRPQPPAQSHSSAPAPSTPAPSAPVTLPSAPNPFLSTGTFSPTTVPDFVINSFDIPPFLIPIYQAAGTEYGIPWQVLAGINQIETDFGRDLSVSSAGALGWMQFMPSTWETYGVDANRDGVRDPYNPVDAIFAAARYLKAAGGDKDIRNAIYAYNHATWYVDSVMLRAQLIAAYPPAFVDALTGLTQGRFPIAAPARYAQSPRSGSGATSIVQSDPSTHGVDIYAAAGAPVIAVGDGVVKDLGREPNGKGYYVVLEDAYGNEYTYEGLGSLSKEYPVPTIDASASVDQGSAQPASAPVPSAAATAGRQQAAPTHERVIVKQRLFAHPERPDAEAAGGLAQMLASGSSKYADYSGYFAEALGLNTGNAVLRPLRKGSAVIATTVLGRVGGQGSAAHIHFKVRPAGKGAPEIDPRPLLDGWRLLESASVYDTNGKDARGRNARTLTIGEIMLMPKPLLERKVLSDKRVTIYAGGREDIATGQIDRRVLEALEYLAAEGLNPTVSALKSGHAEVDATGAPSEHAAGTAVDISAINGVPVKGHSGQGDVVDQTVRKLMALKGTLAPDSIISLLGLGHNTLAQPDHADYIHVGYQPLFGDNSKSGLAALAVLSPSQWQALDGQLGQIGNPVVPTQPSQFAVPAN